MDNRNGRIRRRRRNRKRRNITRSLSTNKSSNMPTIAGTRIIIK
jgi:hypothetical protein